MTYVITQPCIDVIFLESEVPPQWLEFIDLDRSWCTGTKDDKNAVRAWIDEIQPPLSDRKVDGHDDC